MNDVQYKLADAILKYMKDRPISDGRTISEDFFHKGKCELADLHLVLAQLQRDGMIISYPGRNLSFTLSNEGIEAAKKGYKNFFENKSKKAEDKKIREFNQYRWSKQTVIIATLSFIAALISILISVLAMQK